MSQLLARPPAPPPPRRREKRLLSQDEETRSLQAGFILTLLIWPLLILGFIHVMGHGNKFNNKPFPIKPKPSFDIEFAPDQFILPQKQPPPPDRFVETNPDAPENIPDKTRNFAAQNQQVAQEKPTVDGKSDTPATEGKKDFQSNQIVNGRLTPPEKEPPPTPPPTPEIQEAEKQAEARQEKTPLPGFEKREGDDKGGFGSNLAKALDHATPVPEKIEGSKEATTGEGEPTPTQAKIDPQRPMPRPHLQQVRARPAILADNKFGTKNIGPIAYDAKWSNYGQYLQKLVETVQIQWERIIVQSAVYPPTGSTVTVKFRIEATEGGISEIIDTESTGGKQAAEACKSAITARAPYGKWTDDMIAVLGQSQEMTFTFYYGQ